MIKKILTVLFILCICVLTVSQAFASITKTYDTDRYGDANDTLLTWNFDAEAGTYFGYNFDTRSPGMTGIAKITLESNIRDKKQQDFFQDGQYSGKIIIKDLEIKSYFDTRDIRNEQTQAFPLNISWGDIEGIVYLGALYFQLYYNEHDKMDVIGTLDDADLDFSVINYSLITMKDTATYEGSLSNAVGSVIKFDIDEEDGLVGADFLENKQGSFNVGLKVGEGLDLRVGASTKTDYLSSVGNKYNPYAISTALKLKLLEFQNFSYLNVTAKSSISSGRLNNSFLEEGNPLFLGLAFKYRIPIFDGQFGFIPGVGFETQIEFKRIISPNARFQGNAPVSSLNEWIPTQSYEALASLTLDWSARGVLKDKGDHLNFISGAGDVVSDGMSLSMGYGYVPNEIFRTLKVPYIGLKLAIWDSEDEKLGKQGLFPFLETAIIMNINHTYGGTINNFHKIIEVYKDTKTKTFIELGERTDFAIGAQLKYRIAYLRPYGNVFFKNLDINFVEDIYDIENFVFRETRYYDNKADFRMKLGTEFSGFLQNVVFDAYWESGDLVKGFIVSKNLVDEDFFATQDASGKRIFISHSKYGFVAIGVRITF